jgi:ubiquinone/menaquinone biosynthesis C-methylase UbiE
MKINIGAGDTKIDGFVTVDYDTLTNPDYVVDLEKELLPFEDNTVETVIAHHVLEHMGEGFFHCLQELYRVCKSGAIIDVRVPHHRSEAFAADPTHRRPITIVGLQLFSKKFNDICKQNNYASSRLGYFFNVDFEIVDYKFIPNERYRILFQNKTALEIEEYADQHNNIVDEVHVKLVVVK